MVFANFGRVLPYPYGPADGKYFTTLLTLSPVGDDLTLEFAKTLIENEGIRADDVTDYFSVSFTSTDCVGHLFGPSRLDAEDSLLRLDRTPADLLAFVDKKIGLKNTLIVLSADQAGQEVPAQLNQYGIEVNHVDPESWDKAAGIGNLKHRFGVGKKLIQKYFQPMSI